ncbi:MAG: metallophosphoesterase [Muribaculaceae bacterium]|nr:metallophosphoesterase [Muribaculaceae bacterium]
MRFPLLPALIALAVNIALDVYIFRRISRPGLRRAYAGLSAALSLLWTAIIFVPKDYGNDGYMYALMWAVYVYWSFYIPKYVFFVPDAAAAIPHLARRRRWHWLSGIGACLAAVVFAGMWWGALAGRFLLDVKEVSADIPGLPAELKGKRIVQISDWHVGSYDGDTTFVARTVDAINALRPDAVVFTGDLVNRHSDELRPYMATLSRLHAPLGVYSIMGNHDYGDYYNWPSDEAHRADADSLRAMQRRMGWRMLDNEAVALSAPSGRLILIGVENIGEPPFTTRGDLRRAYPTPADSLPKILLSHNPRHWTDSIAGNPDANIALTLSGHTHAMQMRIGGFSPAAWRYPTWGGLYDDGAGHRLYVNTGIGTVGLPMRIGATPEITVITLH